MKPPGCNRLGRFRRFARGHRAAGWLSAWLALAGTILALNAAETPVPSAPQAGPPTVGMEGRLEATLPGTLLAARPVDEKSRVILRIADTRPHGTLIWYDLRYVGLEPGRYDLRDYLVRQNGSATNDLPALPVEVVGLLPPTHQGELVEQPRGVLRLFGGYRNALLAAGAVWALTLVPLLLVGRKPAAAPTAAAVAHEPTLAERLRPLVEQAAAGQLSIDGKAHLERLLLSHWRERLQLGDKSPAEAIAALRQHAEAGALLRALEDWLHRPPGVARVDVSALLAPYRCPPAMPPVGAAASNLPA